MSNDSLAKYIWLVVNFLSFNSLHPCNFSIIMLQGEFK